MSEQSQSIRLSETMAGRMKRGERGVREEVTKRRTFLNALAMNITGMLDKILVCIAVPQHQPLRSGNPDYPPFGNAFSSNLGSLYLPSRSDAPKVKLKRYEQDFSLVEQECFHAERTDGGISRLA